MSRRTRAGGARAPSQRQLRAGELVRHALVEVLTREEIHDAELADASITVSEVRLSPDLRQATCFVMPLAGRDLAAVVGALNRNAPWLASRVAQRVRTKFAPRLRFQPDDSFERAGQIDALLRRDDVRRDLQPDAAQEDDEHGT